MNLGLSRQSTSLGTPSLPENPAIPLLDVPRLTETVWTLCVISLHSSTMAHAHPLSDGPHLPSQHPSYPSYTSSLPCRPPASPRLQDGMSQHHRRLQLRNAGFRGPIVPARRVSPFAGNLTPIQEPFAFVHPISDENSPKSLEKRLLYGEELPPSPINILQQISNSSRRKRTSPRPGIATIFQDSTASKEGEEMRTGSWYHEASNESSPSPHRDTPLRVMKLREISLNEKTIPAGSPLAERDRGKRKLKAKSRASSNESANYIEHLESEITSLTTKLEALTSPTKTKAEIAKLRTLANQVRSQREELAEWEKKFEERVSDEVYERIEVDQGLKTGMKALEDEGEVKEAKIRELEWELETMRLKVKEVESLKATNENLGRRVEVLTELLAQSPTRQDFPSLVSAPGSADPTKRTPWPRSLLLPRIPSSPGSYGNNSSYSADLVSWHGRSIASVSSSSISENAEDEIRSPLNSEQDTTALPGHYSRPTSIGSGFENAFTSDSVFHPSRPTSMTSTFSHGVACGPPVSISLQEGSKSPGRSRKMRRFPSGTCSLKPLILPVAASVTASLPASAPACTSSTLLDNISDSSYKSINPTTSFLSRHDSSPSTTPTQASRQRSKSRVRSGMLDAFEGGPCLVAEGDEESQSPFGELADQSMGTDRRTGSTVTPVARPQRRSLQMELEQAHKTALEAIETAETAQMPERSSQNVQVKTSSALLEPNTIENQAGLRTPSESHLHRRQQLPKPYASKLQTRVSPSSFTSRKTCPTTNILPTNTFGMFTKLTGLVFSLRQDPLILARTILANAWAAGSSNLGGLGWWLLGLIFGSRRPKRDRTADAEAVEEETRLDAFDWSSYTADASKARRILLLSQERQGAFTSLDPHLQREQTDDRDVTAHSPATPASPATPPSQEGPLTSYPYLLHCEKCTEPSSRRTLRLWLRFSLAILFAVGVAVKDGPGTLLEDLKPRSNHGPSTRQRRRDSHDPADATCASSEATLVPSTCLPQPSADPPPAAPVPQRDSCKRNLNDGYWGWEVTFAETLGLADSAKEL